MKHVFILLVILIATDLLYALCIAGGIEQSITIRFERWWLENLVAVYPGGRASS